jgi:GNAT superfamily N-acetyltransferase
MRIIEVSDRKSRYDFLRVPKLLYKRDPYWVCPLDNDTENTFIPSHNPLFKEGNACRWILKDEKNNLIGRIAAFHHRDYVKSNQQPTGGIGWFECINDQGAAKLLFDTAKEWLQKEGMEAMDGPVNFGETDINWGLLVAGFTHPGFGMTYNFPYYSELFENYGFLPYYEQYSYHIDITKEFPDRFWKIADWIMKKPDFRFEHVRIREKEKYIQDMVKIYNEAWGEFKENFIPLQPYAILKTFKKAKPVIIEELIWFVYHKDEPVAFFIMLPDVNMIFKHLNGKLHFINILRFLYYKNTHTIKRIRALIAGVIPKYQGTGIESAVFKKLETVFTKHPWWTEIELSWVGDFNPRMRAVYEAVGAKLAKKHITFRYLFDREAKFERFMPDSLKNYDKMKLKSFQTEVSPDSGAIRKKYNYLKYKKH